MQSKTLLIATAVAAMLGYAGVAQATVDNDGGPSGRLHEGRTVAAPHFSTPRFFAPYHRYHYGRHRGWEQGRGYYRY
jgi:hypothetical protein